MENDRSKVRKQLSSHDIAQINRLHNSGLNYSEITRCTGFSMPTISKYISKKEKPLPIVKGASRDIANLEVVTALEFYKTEKPSITYKEIQQKLIENGICTHENVPSISHLSKCSSLDLGNTYKNLTKSQKRQIRMRFKENLTIL